LPDEDADDAELLELLGPLVLLLELLLEEELPPPAPVELAVPMGTLSASLPQARKAEA
jgi:hypothetical protein